MKIIAVAHPGKIGDALWCLPTVKALCEKHDAVADFFTSDYCRPMKDLLEAQPFIRQMIMSAGYEVKSMDCGCQPPLVPVPEEGYSAVYQMGFNGCPAGCIGEYIAEKSGMTRDIGRKVEYVVPPPPLWFSSHGYIVLNPRGETSFAPLLREFAKQSPLPTVEIGAAGQAVIREQDSPNHFNVTCDSMLKMASIISGAKAFVGLMSAPLVIANGFPRLTKIVLHDGKSWDMSHVLYTPTHHYLVDPTLEQLLSLTK